MRCYYSIYVRTNLVTTRVPLTIHVPVFVTMHASSRQGRLNSDLSIIVVLRPITACIFHVEVARCTPSQRGTVVCCFAVTLRWV